MPVRKSGITLALRRQEFCGINCLSSTTARVWGRVDSHSRSYGGAQGFPVEESRSNTLLGAPSPSLESCWCWRWRRHSKYKGIGAWDWLTHGVSWSWSCQQPRFRAAHGLTTTSRLYCPACRGCSSPTRRGYCHTSTWWSSSLRKKKIFYFFTCFFFSLFLLLYSVCLWSSRCGDKTFVLF